MLDVANCFLYSTSLGVCENFTQRQAFSWIMNILSDCGRHSAHVTHFLGINIFSVDSNYLTMTLEDFEKSLAEEKNKQEKTDSNPGLEKHKKHHRHHRKHYDDGEDHHRRKRKKRSASRDDNDRVHGSRKSETGLREERMKSENSRDNSVRETWDLAAPSPRRNDVVLPTSSSNGETKRDSWMEQPSSLDIDYTQKGVKKASGSKTSTFSKADFGLKIHENELNKHHLENLAEGKDIPENISGNSAQSEVDYVFGDAGAQWRMSKLNRVYKTAEETGKSVDDIAEERFGDLKAFDEAREEQIELERRETYGEGYVGKDKPSGELFEERKLEMGLRNEGSKSEHDRLDVPDFPRDVSAKKPAAMTVPLDQTALNRLKAQMMKAKIRRLPNAAELETEYNAAAAFANSKQPDVIVLGAMDNRMLAGSREGEVTRTDNKRGRERGLVEENEDMSIADMVRQERRSRNQAGGEGQRFAERIARDAKFDVCELPHRGFFAELWSE